jgi:hypothetical protein
MNRILASMFVILFAGAGCAPMPPSRVDTARSEGPDKSYTVDLPIGWIKQGSPDSRNLFASRDGFLLEAIAIKKQPIKEAFPKTKKAATAQMLPAELAELEIAEIKSQDQFTAALTVTQNEPAEIAGQEGFCLRVRFRNTGGLEIQRVVYGLVDKSAYYEIAFQAPMLYYFDKYYPDFEKVVESFQLTAAASAANK